MTMPLHGVDRGDKAEASASLVGVSAVSHPAISRFLAEHSGRAEQCPLSMGGTRCLPLTQSGHWPAGEFCAEIDRRFRAVRGRG
jgi:hypothetical protein